MDFQAYQRAFTRRIRDPRGAPRPQGVPAQRMRVYEELLYNNVESFLLQCFPVCRRILGKRRWTRLARAFFRDHACSTPYFHRIPEEFLRYLEGARPLPKDYPDFLPELAHYEWVELALETSDLDASTPAHDPHGDLIAGRPLLNPVAMVLTYRYPVHRLSPRYRPDEPPAAPTHLLAFRDASLEVRFVVINAATARLLATLQTSPELSGYEALVSLARELDRAPEALLRHGRALLQDLRELGLILGTRRA